MVQTSKTASNSRLRTVMEPEIRVIRIKEHQRYLASYLKMLSKDEKARAQKFTVKGVRERFILSRGVLRRLIGAKLGIKASSIIFAYGPHGKPQLDSVMSGIKLDGPFHFNVSHSRDMVLICLGAVPLGADIEFVRKLINPDRIAEKIISPRKIKVYRSLPTKVREELLLQIWTRKESIVKAIGSGLSVPVKNIVVWVGNKKSPYQFADTVKISDRCIGTYTIENHEVTLPKNYVGAVSFVATKKI